MYRATQHAHNFFMRKSYSYKWSIDRALLETEQIGWEEKIVLEVLVGTPKAASVWIENLTKLSG
jgi:hypothetical protein